MIRRIVLENFMSHAHTVIELSEGLSVLVGPNNCGKSAVVEALRAVCNNAQGSYMVRHGEKETRVTIETDDGHRIVWKRRNAPSYEIDGQPFDRLKGSVPEKLHEYLRMACVETSQGNRFDVHFGLQKAPIFLLDDAAGSKTADFFSSASDAEKLMRMQQLHREKVRNARERKKELDSEMLLVGKQLDALEVVKALAGNVEDAEKEHEALTWDMGVAREISGNIERLESAEVVLRRRMDERAACQMLSTPPVLEEIKPLDEMVSSLSRSTRSRLIHGDRARALGALHDPPVTEDADSLASIVEKLELCAGRRECIARAAEHLADLRGAPEAVDLAPLQQVLIQLADHRRRATAHALEVVELGKQMEDVKEQMRAWVAAHPVCPTCGAATDPQRILDGEHRHA